MKTLVQDKIDDMVSKKIVLVTGASFGIGEALLRELISKGRMVIGLSRNTEKLSKIKDEVGPAFIPITCDVSNKSDIYTACKNILDQGLFPTTFFLNAGMA